MKKLITCITAATILMAGSGCGDTGDGAQGGEGYGLQGNRVGTGSGGAGHGQHQRGLAGTEGIGAGGQQGHGQVGQRGHQGQGQQGQQGQTARNGAFTRGIVGNDRPGMVDENGLLNGRMRAHDRAADRQGLNQGTGQQQRNFGGAGGVHGRTGAGGASPYGADGTGTGGAGGITGGAGAGGATGGVGAGGTDGAGGAGIGAGRAGRAGQGGAGGTGAGGAIANRDTNNQDYYDTNEGRSARRIEERVDQIDGVQDADVIISDDEVVIGIRGTDINGNNGNNGDNNDTESKVRSVANDMIDDKQIHVVTDAEGAQQIHQMEGQLRGGAAFDEVGSTFNAMLDDLGDAIQRPFERSR